MSNLIILIYFFQIVFLFLMSIDDLKSYEIKKRDIKISFFLNLMLCYLNNKNLFNYNANFFILKLESILILVLLNLLLFGLYNYQQEKIGLGDLQLFLVFSIGLGLKVIELIFLSSLMGIIFLIIFGKKKIPFLPYITISYLIILKF